MTDRLTACGIGAAGQFRQAGLGKVRFCAPRHAFAIPVLLRGAKPKVISKGLAHASAAFTMDTCSHIIGEMQENLMAPHDEASPSGVPQASPKRQMGQFHDSAPA